MAGLTQASINRDKQIARLKKKQAEKARNAPPEVAPPPLADPAETTESEATDDPAAAAPPDAGTIEGSDADRPQLDLWGSDLLVAEEDSDTVRSAALQSLEAIESERQRVAAKAAGGAAAVTPDMVRAAGNVCKVGKVHLDTAGSAGMSDDERRKLAALVGNGKTQNVRLFNGRKGETIVINEETLGQGGDGAGGGAPSTASLALVLASCEGCQFTIDCYCAKVFARGLVDCVVTLAPNSKVITATLEVERCTRTALRIGSMLGTLQVEQCAGMIADFASRDCFGNGSMERKGREFGNDGMVVWAGCDDLRVRIGDAALGDHVVFCDFAVAATADRTLNRDRSQFKVSFAGGRLVSEKVVRLKNGFPATKREVDDFDQREEGQLQVRRFVCLFVASTPGQRVLVRVDSGVKVCAPPPHHACRTSPSAWASPSSARPTLSARASSRTNRARAAREKNTSSAAAAEDEGRIVPKQPAFAPRCVIAIPHLPPPAPARPPAPL